MLVLSRKPNERIWIGDEITVTVVRISPHNVRLGIDAPRHLTVIREELEQRQKAAHNGAGHGRAATKDVA